MEVEVSQFQADFGIECFKNSKQREFRMLRRSVVTSGAVLASIVFTSAFVVAGENQKTVTYSIGIKGLTCETCSASAQRELATVPGVVKSSVDWKAGHAWVTFRKPSLSPVPPEKPQRISAQLATAIKRAGANHGDGFTPTVNYLLTVKGMTCEACSTHVTSAVRKVPGVAAATVSYKGGYAVVVPSAKSAPNPKSLVRAVEDAGYNATVMTGP